MEKKNKFLKKVSSFLCVLTMVFGSVVMVDAKIVTFPSYISGDTSISHVIYFDGDGRYEGRTYQFNISNAESKVYHLKMCGQYSSDVYSFGTLWFSTSPFDFSYMTGAYSSAYKEGNFDEAYQGAYDSLSNNLVSKGDFYTANVKTCVGNKNYYYIYFPSQSAGNAQSVANYDNYDILECNIPIIKFNNYVSGYINDSCWGSLFDAIYATDMTYDDGLASEFSGDLSGALSNSSLGYLQNLRTKTLSSPVTQEDYYMNRYVMWDNTHEDWDESYKVALYVKFWGTVAGFMTTDEYESEMYYMDSVNYSECEVFYNVYGEKYQQYSEEFRTYLESKKTFLNNQIAFGADHWLIIYHETEEGMEYGYWNHIESATSTGVVAEGEYGYFDDNGNFVKVGDNDVVQHESGVGETPEDAEQNKDTYTPENDFDNAGSLTDSIGTMFSDFFDSLKSAFSFVGDFPNAISSFFGFLPKEVITCISVGIFMLVILRFLGR